MGEVVETAPMDDPHLVRLSGRVDQLEVSVADIKSGVSELLKRPATVGWSQVIGTAFTTLATVGLIFGFAEWRLNQAVAPVAQAQIEIVSNLQAEAVRMAVLEERMSWIRSLQGWQPKSP